MTKKSLVLITLFVMLVSRVAGQSEESALTYSSKDGLFSFDYPADWLILESVAGRISFATNESAMENGVQVSGDVLGTIFTPAYLARFNGIKVQAEPRDVLALVLTDGDYADAVDYPLTEAIQATASTDNGQRLAVAFNTGNGVALLMVDTFGEEQTQIDANLLAMMGSALNSSAAMQPLVQTFTAPDGSLQFNYPAGWIVAESAEPGTYFVANSEAAAGSYVGTSGVMQATVYPPEFLTNTLGFPPDASLLEIAVQIPTIFSQDIIFEEAIPITISTRSAYVTAGINSTDLEAYIYMIETDKGIGMMLFAGPMVELIQYEPTFEGMLASLQFDVPVEVTEIPVISADAPLEQTVLLSDETLQFQLPMGWAVAETVEGTAYIANSTDALDRAIVVAPPASGELQILLLNNDFIAAQGIDVKTEPLKVAEAVISTIFGDLDFDFSDPAEIQVAGQKLIQWEAVNPEIETVGYLIPIENGVVVMFCGAPSGELNAYREILPVIARTMERPEE